MTERFKNSIDRFYFEMTISELRQMNEKQEMASVTYNSLLYLDIIAYQTNCTVSYIASSLNISKSAVTSKVKELIAEGLVIKTQSEGDKRVFFLDVVEPYRSKCNRYNKIFGETIDEVSRQYTKEEVETFCKILDRFSDNYLRITN